MIKRTFTYENLDGEKVSEEYLFNLTQSELRELFYEREGGIYAYAQTIVSTSSNAKALNMIIGMVMRSVGIRSEDGRRIIKTDEVRDRFRFSPCYDELMNEVFDPEEWSKFLLNVVPKDKKEELEAAIKAEQEKAAEEAKKNEAVAKKSKAKQATKVKEIKEADTDA